MVFMGDLSLFFKRFLKNPRQLGTLAPISKKLAHKAALCIPTPSKAKIVDFGAGTGPEIQAFLDMGVKAENIIAIELDPELARHLKNKYPQIKVIEGDASLAHTLIPKAWHGQVDVVFSAIPFAYIPQSVRENITEAAFSILHPKGRFLHLTYSLWSPLEAYKKDLIVSLWANVPPAFIWRYFPKANQVEYKKAA